MRHLDRVLRGGGLEGDLEHLGLRRRTMVGHRLQDQTITADHIGDRQATCHHALAVSTSRCLPVQIRIKAHRTAIGAIVGSEGLGQRVQRESRRVAGLVLQRDGIDHGIDRGVVIDLHRQRAAGRIAIAIRDLDAEGETVGFLRARRSRSRCGVDHRRKLLVGVGAIGIHRQHRYVGDMGTGAGQGDEAIGGQVARLCPGNGLLRGLAACSGIDINGLHGVATCHCSHINGLEAICAGQEQDASCRAVDHLGISHIARATSITAQLSVVVQHRGGGDRLLGGNRCIVIDLDGQ